MICGACSDKSDEAPVANYVISNDIRAQTLSKFPNALNLDKIVLGTTYTYEIQQAAVDTPQVVAEVFDIDLERRGSTTILTADAGKRGTVLLRLVCSEQQVAFFLNKTPEQREGKKYLLVFVLNAVAKPTFQFTAAYGDEGGYSGGVQADVADVVILEGYLLHVGGM